MLNLESVLDSCVTMRLTHCTCVDPGLQVVFGGDGAEADASCNGCNGCEKLVTEVSMVPVTVETGIVNPVYEPVDRVLREWSRESLEETQKAYWRLDVARYYC